MDASREELQSLNEELTTLNGELQGKVEELAKAQAFVENLLAATNLATVVLDQSLQVVRYTPAALALFHLVPTDQGRLLEDIKTTFTAEHLAEDCRQTLTGGQIVERDIHVLDGHWYLERVYPYRDPTGEVAGVVLTFAEVTQLKEAEEVLCRGKEELESLVASRTEELAEKVRLLDLANVMDGYVGKPVDLEELEKTILQVLGPAAGREDTSGGRGHDVAGGAEIGMFGLGQKLRRPQGQKQADADRKQRGQRQLQGFRHRFPPVRGGTGGARPPSAPPDCQENLSRQPLGQARRSVGTIAPRAGNRVGGRENGDLQKALLV